jgi:hypothetical protein
LLPLLPPLLLLPSLLLLAPLALLLWCCLSCRMLTGLLLCCLLRHRLLARLLLWRCLSIVGSEAYNKLVNERHSVPYEFIYVQLPAVS